MSAPFTIPPNLERLNGMSTPRMSTFVVDHAKCDPGKWTAEDLMTLKSFLVYGNVGAAVHLARMGVFLATSEALTVKGGTMEHIGWGDPADRESITDDLRDAVENLGGQDITPLCRVFREKPVYVARFMTGSDGDVDTTEYEVLTSEEDAKAFLASMKAEDAAETDDLNGES
jgi:hypothetical protein